MSRLPLIIAHRGASTHAPENTLAAFQMAIDVGSDGIEFDVRLSADGVPVVIHDATLKRTASLHERVDEMTADELAEIDVGSWFNERYPSRVKEQFAGQGVSTLAQVLDLLSGFPGIVYIELKTEKGNFGEIARAVCNTIGGSSMLPQIIIKSFDLAALREVLRYLVDVRTSALFSPKALTLFRPRIRMLDLAREFGADEISIHYSLVTSRLARNAAEAGIPMAIWPVDDPKWLARCEKLGIRSLITNDPALMLAKRRQ